MPPASLITLPIPCKRPVKISFNFIKALSLTKSSYNCFFASSTRLVAASKLYDQIAYCLAKVPSELRAISIFF